MLLKLELVLLFAALILLFGTLARRYGRRRVREGTWDEHGPKNPTSVSEDYSHSRGRQAFDWFNRSSTADSRDAEED